MSLALWNPYRMTTARTVLASGYIALDVIRYGTSIRHRAGGTAANVAANLAYFGWSSRLLGRLGRDAPARRILYDLKLGGVDGGHLERDSTLDTPVVLHVVDPPRHRFLFTCPVCARKLPSHRPVSFEHLNGAVRASLQDGTPHVFFFDRASAPNVALAEELKSRGTLVFFEPSSAGVRQRTLRAADLADILKWSAEQRPGFHAELFAKRAGQLQIESHGADGLAFRVGANAWRPVAAPAIDAIDPGGAGDWLTASLLDRLPTFAACSLDPEALTEALEGAQATAALSCCYVGARTLTGVPLRALRKAEKAVLDTRGPRLPPIPMDRPSRALGVCRVCLGAQNVIFDR